MPALPRLPWALVLVASSVLATASPAPAANKPARYLIAPDRISHEIGHCYIARMDFGEEGDKVTRNRSMLQLFEDGKPLGPGKALHADIREKGQGRFSHWGRDSLYFSASDNTDPSTNGRAYEVASENPDSALGGIDRFISEVKTHRQVITASRHQYKVALGGNLDAENTLTRSHTNFAIAFQPNVSLTIENTGDEMVAWPKLIANGQKDWSTYDALLEDFTRGATSDQEKALFIWQAARENRYHSTPLFADAEFHDPVKMFNSYGLQLCDDMGYCGCSLFKHAGLGKPKYAIDPKVRCLHGHMMCEAVVDGKHQFLDIDQDVFYLDRECRRPISGDECSRDHDLVRREVNYGPVFGGWGGSESSASLFGDDDAATHGFVRGHEMRYRLRSGEKVVFRWDNVDKWACQSEKWNHRPNYFGNSRFLYTPRLSPDQYKEGISGQTDTIPATAEGAQLAGASPRAFLTYDIDIPWAICGGTLSARFIGLGEQDRFTLDVSLDGKSSVRVWEGAGPGEVLARVPIDEALKPHNSPAKYHYSVTVGLSSAGADHGANLASLQIETDVMAAPVSLPGLRRGENTFEYTDLQDGPHEVTITHQWRECHGLTPPATVPKPDYPTPGATVRDSTINFRWPAVEGCSRYHIQVSRRPDFRVPYRPSYDVVIPATEWCVPYAGMFAVDTTYYWRIRARNKWGIWSPFSPPWTFRWEGPMVPIGVRSEKTPGGITLHWQANPRGTTPVAYEVYGSDEKGFSVHAEPYKAYIRGQVPANLLGRTTDTSMLVVSGKPTHANMNRCYYRVVAVDENGTRSNCSDYVEMPHPSFWSIPPSRAEAGKPFAYEPGVITSLGDVQHRYEAPGNKLWDAEQLEFSLAAGPDWLTIDKATGKLTGTPPAPGRFEIQLSVKNQSGGGAQQSFEVTVP